MTESDWKSLLNKIDEGTVVPIVGSRLLVDANGDSLQAKFAERMLADVNAGREVPIPPIPDALPPFRELNEAVTWLRTNQFKDDLYECVCNAIKAVTLEPGFVIPTPIRQLSEIASFQLYVTLTPDDLLCRCLRERCSVTEIVHTLKLTSSDCQDLNADWNKMPGVVHILYLFGKMRSDPMFAIHDEDLLEYAHNVVSPESWVPSDFLRAMQERNLLLVGCNFPDWLTRFFLRYAHRDRLSLPGSRAWFIEPLRPEDSLTRFLNCYSKETKILSADPPVHFVADLHDRWMNRHGAETLAPGVPETEVVPPGVMFFISYSRQTDSKQAQRLYDSLVALGVAQNEIWLDRNTIEPGNDFRRRIIDGIHDCRYFLPLVSFLE